jgi:hypothetical protein
MTLIAADIGKLGPVLALDDDARFTSGWNRAR